MQLNEISQKSNQFKHFKLLANQVMEGFISGIHKSPFHGYSAEFAEHKIYNKGESTKHIDWKLYGKTNKLYTKKYEEETNLRCQVIIDASSSMYYQPQNNKLRKIDFSIVAALSLIKILQKQRDAVGLSIYDEDLLFHQKAKGNNAHLMSLESELNKLHQRNPKNKKTKSYTFLHQLAENLNRRSLVFIFSDLLQTEVENNQLIEAIQNLKFNKHQVVIFHTINKNDEYDFNFENKAVQFKDIETEETINLFADQIKTEYQEKFLNYTKSIKEACLKYRINYQYCDVDLGIESLIKSFLKEVQ